MAPKTLPELGSEIRERTVEPRGPLNEILIDALQTRRAPSKDIEDGQTTRHAARAALTGFGDVVRDDDIQLALFLLYGLHYGSLPWLDASWEWHPEPVTTRTLIERAFESQLRSAVTITDPPPPNREAVAEWLFAATTPSPGPSLARYVAKKATLDQLREFMMHRSIYTLREADPHSWAIPRLTGRPKAALVEIQSDEYGGGTLNECTRRSSPRRCAVRVSTTPTAPT